MLLGAGNVALLPKEPHTLWFKNDTADPVTVEVLAGRTA